MSENTDEISLKELIIKIGEWARYLLSKWLIIAIFGVIGAIGGLLYAIYKQPTYTGTLTFVLSNGSKAGGSLAGLAGQFGLDIGGGGSDGAFEGENIIELLKSRRIVKGALFKEVPEEKKMLINVIGESAGFFNSWSKSARLKQIIPFPKDIERITPLQDSLVGVLHSFILKKYFKISKPDKKLSFYEASTTSPFEVISIYLTKGVVSEAAKMYIDTKTKTAKDNLAMLQHEADSLRARLSGTIYSAASTVDATFNLNQALQVQRAPIQQGQIQAQLLGAAYGEVIKNLEIAKIALLRETPLYQVIDEPAVPLISRKLGKIKTVIVVGVVAIFVSVCVLSARMLFEWKNHVN
jgi:hypothetical protein